MYRLLSLSALLLVARADPRTPKIYNVLISTKKNLSPSHALPIYEPVLRTTSLGIALPPIFYQSPLGTFEPNYVHKAQPVENPHGDELQKPFQQFIPYGYNPQGFYPPLNEPNQPQASPELSPKPEEAFQKPDDPKNVIANLKRNPNIPDVPPPALPTRNIT